MHHCEERRLGSSAARGLALLEVLIKSSFQMKVGLCRMLYRVCELGIRHTQGANPSAQITGLSFRCFLSCFCKLKSNKTEVLSVAMCGGFLVQLK